MEIIKRPFSDFSRIFDILQYQKEKYPNPAALNAFSSNKWQPVSIQEIQDRVDAIACHGNESGGDGVHSAAAGRRLESPLVYADG